MPKRIPVKKIILQRDKKMMSPEIGVEFDFTAEELADINKLAPNSIRKVVIEDKLLAEEAERAEKAETERRAKEAADQAAKDKAAAKHTNTPAQAAAAKRSAADL